MEEKGIGEMFSELFSKFIKNREVLCDNEGRLKERKYLKKYQLLGNKVAILGMMVIEEKIGYYYPANELGEACCNDIKRLMSLRREALFDEIRKGTEESFLKKGDEFAEEARKIYWDYVSRGMIKEDLKRRRTV